MSITTRDVAEQDGGELTRERILDSAETLFARDGVENVSLRAVTAAAGANVAAVHYHFGTKEDLLRAIFVRRMTPLLLQRTQNLQKCLAAKRMNLEDVLTAYVQPAFDYDCAVNDYGFHRLFARLSFENTKFNADHFYFIQSEHNRSFVDALSGILPKVSREELAERLDMVVGLIVHAIGRRAHDHQHGGEDAAREKARIRDVVRAASAILAMAPR
jgi:AcrR family transcriptional regulator